MTSPAQEVVHEALAQYLGVPSITIKSSNRLEEDLGLDALDVILIAIGLERVAPTIGEFPLARLEAARDVRALTAAFRHWWGREGLAPRAVSRRRRGRRARAGEKRAA